MHGARRRLTALGLAACLVARQAAGQPEKALFDEHFDGGDGDLPAAWRVLEGSAKVEHGRLHLTSDRQNPVIRLERSFRGDLAIRLRLRNAPACHWSGLVAKGCYWLTLNHQYQSLFLDRRGGPVPSGVAAEDVGRQMAKLGSYGLSVWDPYWTPDWAARPDADPGARAMLPPRDLADFERYVFETVKHYRGAVSHWEVWNEPHYAGFWRGTPEEYVDLCRVAHRAAKRADPAAVILGGGGVALLPSTRSWIERALAAGLLEGARFRQTVPLPGNAVAHVFTRDQECIAVCWVNSGHEQVTRRLTFGAGGSWTVRDVMGNRRALVPARGALELPLTREPVFVIASGLVPEQFVRVMASAGEA
jgi:hypothetical protein